MRELYVKKGKKYELAPDYFNVDNEILMFCAFRYALGRMTYVVGTVIEALKEASKGMSKITKDKYVNEIVEYWDNHGTIGMDFDTTEWLQLAAFLDEENTFKFEANFHNTDRWEEFEGFFFNGGYYSRETYKEFHTVRNVVGPEYFKTKIIINESKSEEVTL